MRPINSPPTSRRIGLTMSLVLLGGAACNNAASDDEDITTKQGAVTPSTAPELRSDDDPEVPDPVAAVLHVRADLTRNAQGQVTRKEFTVRMAKVQRPAAAAWVPVDAAVRLRRQRVHEVRRERPGRTGARADRTGDVPAHVARAEVRADANVPDMTHYRNELAGDTSAWPSIRRWTGRIPTTSPSRRRRSWRSRPGTRRRSRRSRTRRTRTASRWCPSSTGRPTPGSRSTTSAGPNTCRTTTRDPTATSRRRSGTTTTRSARPAWTSASGCRGSRSCAIRPASRSIALGQ